LDVAHHPEEVFEEGVIKSYCKLPSRIGKMGGIGKMPVTLIISCGCGFKTTSLEEAEKHAKETKHILRIQGTVTPPMK